MSWRWYRSRTRSRSSNVHLSRCRRWDRRWLLSDAEERSRESGIGDLNLRHESSSLRDETRLWSDSIDLHIINELSWKFSECFCGELDRIVETVEGNELDDISLGSLWTRSQKLVITVENIHLCEICVSYSYDDDGHR